MPDTKDQRDSYCVRMQSPDELRRADGRARCQAGHRSSGRSADHHVYRLHHFRRLSRPGHSHVSIISRTKGNAYNCGASAAIDRGEMEFFVILPNPLLQSDRTTIHKNLCVCLLIAEVLFVCGIGQTNQRIVCGIVAGLLHFFFLCAFAWMFLEGWFLSIYIAAHNISQHTLYTVSHRVTGFQLYVMLIEVFEAEKSRLRWYYLVAYGAPLVVVAISCIIDPLSYGTDRYCWLRADNYFIFSFVGPVILVILVIS